MPDSILGCRVGFEKHKNSHDAGLRVSCTRHARCSLFRSIALDRHLYGPRAAEFFLGAWLLIDDHKGKKPTAAQIKDHMENYS